MRKKKHFLAKFKIQSVETLKKIRSRRKQIRLVACDTLTSPLGHFPTSVMVLVILTSKFSYIHIYIWCWYIHIICNIVVIEIFDKVNFGHWQVFLLEETELRKEQQRAEHEKLQSRQNIFS